MEKEERRRVGAGRICPEFPAQFLWSKIAPSIFAGQQVFPSTFSTLYGSTCRCILLRSWRDLEKPAPGGARICLSS